MKKLLLVIAIVSVSNISAQTGNGCNTNRPGWGESLGEIRFSKSEGARNPELHHNRVIRNEAGLPIQLWSSPVEAENCRKETFNGGNARRGFNADCRSGLTADHTSLSLFSWCAIVKFAEELCPAPWRVPTVDDFITLDKALGGTGSVQNSRDLASAYIHTWGFIGVHHVNDRGRLQAAAGRYWAVSEKNETDGFILYVSRREPFTNNAQGHALKSFGHPLRCVRTDDGILEIGQHLAEMAEIVRAEGEARAAQREAQRIARENRYLCNNNTPGWGESLGTVTFKTDRTWIVGEQEWSDVVMASNCSEKTTFVAGTWNSGAFFSDLNADCRSNPGFGDLFSWCAVHRFKDQLCPDGWRVPTKDDFIALDIAMGGTGTNTNERYRNTQNLIKRYLDPEIWGGTLNGLCTHDGQLFEWRINQDNELLGIANYWTQTESLRRSHGRTEATGYFFTFTHPRMIGFLYIEFRTSPSYGLSIRCVR